MYPKKKSVFNVNDLQILCNVRSVNWHPEVNTNLSVKCSQFNSFKLDIPIECIAVNVNQFPIANCCNNNIVIKLDFFPCSMLYKLKNLVNRKNQSKRMCV